MSIPYTYITQYTGSINSNGYLNDVDSKLFYVSQSADIWFGLSTNDVIEVAAYTTDDQTLAQWGIVGRDKHYQTSTLTYLNSINNISQYSYNELVSPFTIYKNQSILLQAASDLASIGITDSSYIISYNFTRDMAGSMLSPLVIKDISNSRTEVKLIPNGDADIAYNSFGVKRFPIKDVAQVLLSNSKNIQYDQIYKEMTSLVQYQNGISFLKFMFFLNNDGAVVTFLKNLYEDYIKYSFLAPTQTNSSGESTTLTRIQGIKTYYNNFILQNYETVASFDGIRRAFISFVNVRLQQRFGQFNEQIEQGFKDARQFCYDFFVTYFYDDSITPLKDSYEDKYFGQFKNVLNFGSNQYYIILDHKFMDERVNPTDPMTLVIKLPSALPSNISVKNLCWVSNFGMTPYTFTAIILNPVKYKTIQISPPNFGSPQLLINKEQSNTLYSSDDLASDPSVEDQINLNKNIAELNTDYTNFSNFVLFSSAVNRLEIFKNKMVQWTAATDALAELERRYNISLSSSIPYPYYSVEKEQFTTQASDIINSFDSHEAFLFNSGKYQYVISSGSFRSASYVADQDTAADEYDRNNPDMLATNIPQYLIDDTNSSEYLTFLNMIGHHFDNIYVYLAALPIERQIRNELTASIPLNTLKETLYSFGWNVDDMIGSLDIDEVYLNSMDSSSYYSLSGQQRLQTIWNRILVNLPGIYKNKGTEECVNYLMSCYGLPSSLISVREYGGTDFADDTKPTYVLDEKNYMLQFSGIGDYVEGPIPNSTRTLELKFSIDSDKYDNYKFIPLFVSVPYPYTSSVYCNWTVGCYRVPGQYTGKVVFQMGSGSSGLAITSSVLPIFNGEIFSVMLRRNYPFGLFESSLDLNVIPLEYNLHVQRNENGRRLFYSTSSAILYDDDNDVFAQFGRFRLTAGNFKGTLDKVSIWDVPLDDNDFEEHVNDLNSYGFSGSVDNVPYKNLWVRLNWDYPQDMFSLLTSSVWIDNKAPYYFISNYYTDETLTSINPIPYSSSLMVIAERWATYYPTGSIEIRGYNFPQAIGSAFSASWKDFPYCLWFSQSVYPYHFRESTYQQNFDASKYGPNRYKNKRIRKIDYEIDARFDSYDRSTRDEDLTISGESNQLGFFIDPQDSKNKDILRYVGRNGIMELIGDPSNLYSDKYYDLINKNNEYNLDGEKKTYFNELLTVYKFYFDKSIFQAIKNVMPARANAYTGVVIEPTILERPKYQNKEITSSMQATYQDPTILNQLYTFSEDLLWADFHIDWNLYSTASSNHDAVLKKLRDSYPPSYQQVIDLNYLTYPNRDWPENLPGGAFMNDYMDRVQHDFYPNFEQLPRLWESSDPAYNQPIIGSVTNTEASDYVTVGGVVIGPDHGVYDTKTYFSGSNTGDHQIVYYMLKVWDRYYYYAKSGDYVRSTNPLDNTYASASAYLYKYIIIDERLMRTLVYFTNLVSGSLFGPNDITYTWSGPPNTGVYLHKASTFINTPDQPFSNIKAVANFITPINRAVFDLTLSPQYQYFELASGYPRNHYTHKLQQFSKLRYGDYYGKVFIKGRQTSDSTVNMEGIPDGTPPYQSSNTSNVNVTSTGNILRTVPTIIAGQTTPSGTTTTTTTTRHTEPTRPRTPVAGRVPFGSGPVTVYVLPVAVWGATIQNGIVYYRLIEASSTGTQLYKGQFVSVTWAQLWNLLLGKSVTVDGQNVVAIPPAMTAFWKIQMGLSPQIGILG